MHNRKLVACPRCNSMSAEVGPLRDKGLCVNCNTLVEVPKKDPWTRRDLLELVTALGPWVGPIVAVLAHQEYRDSRVKQPQALAIQVHDTITLLDEVQFATERVTA